MIQLEQKGLRGWRDARPHRWPSSLIFRFSAGVLGKYPQTYPEIMFPLGVLWPSHLDTQTNHHGGKQIYGTTAATEWPRDPGKQSSLHDHPGPTLPWASSAAVVLLFKTTHIFFLLNPHEVSVYICTSGHLP